MPAWGRPCTHLHKAVCPPARHACGALVGCPLASALVLPPLPVCFEVASCWLTWEASDGIEADAPAFSWRWCSLSQPMMSRYSWPVFWGQLALQRRAEHWLGGSPCRSADSKHLHFAAPPQAVSGNLGQKGARVRRVNATENGALDELTSTQPGILAQAGQPNPKSDQAQSSKWTAQEPGRPLRAEIQRKNHRTVGHQTPRHPPGRLAGNGRRRARGCGSSLGADLSIDLCHLSQMSTSSSSKEELTGKVGPNYKSSPSPRTSNKGNSRRPDRWCEH
eukprot:1161182-Pelagomonas_calceolata.AAC.6